MQSYQIVELNFNEIDGVAGGPLPLALIALAPAALAALEGIALGGTIYAGFKLAFD